MFCSRRWPLTKQFKLYTLCSCIKKWTNKNLWILPWPRGKFDSIAVVKLFVEKAKFFATAVLRCYRQDMDRESFKNFCPSRLVFFCILQYRIALCRTNKWDLHLEEGEPKLVQVIKFCVLNACWYNEIHIIIIYYLGIWFSCQSLGSIVCSVIFCESLGLQLDWF